MYLYRSVSRKMICRIVFRSFQNIKFERFCKSKYCFIALISSSSLIVRRTNRNSLKLMNYFLWHVFFLFILACITISEGNTYSRSCSSGYYLEITSARWYCNSKWNSNSLTVTSRVNSNCNYQTSCTLRAEDSWLGGDPCPLYSKYLYWADTCKCK